MIDAIWLDVLERWTFDESYTTCPKCEEWTFKKSRRACDHCGHAKGAR